MLWYLSNVLCCVGLGWVGLGWVGVVRYFVDTLASSRILPTNIFSHILPPSACSRAYIPDDLWPEIKTVGTACLFHSLSHIWILILDRLFSYGHTFDHSQQRMLEEMKSFKMGQPDEFDTFIGAVIDKNSFNNIKTYIENARQSPDCEIIGKIKLSKNKKQKQKETVKLLNVV